MPLASKERLPEVVSNLLADLKGSNVTIKNLLSGLVALGALSVAPVSNAANFVFDYSWDGSSLTVNQAPTAGQSLSIGDTVDAYYHAVGGYWTATGANIWAAVSLFEGGMRSGDYNWSASDNGALVASGNLSNVETGFVHIGTDNFGVPVGTQFDLYGWSFTLASSTASGNTFSGSNFTGSGDPLANWGGTTFNTAPVPEPETYAMMLAGLGLLGFWGRHRKR